MSNLYNLNQDELNQVNQNVQKRMSELNYFQKHQDVFCYVGLTIVLILAILAWVYEIMPSWATFIVWTCLTICLLVAAILHPTVEFLTREESFKIVKAKPDYQSNYRNAVKAALN